MFNLGPSEVANEGTRLSMPIFTGYAILIKMLNKGDGQHPFSSVPSCWALNELSYGMLVLGRGTF